MTSSGGSLTKAGLGSLTLSGSNAFTGGVMINNGTLQLGSTGALNSTAGWENAVTFGASAPSTATLNLNGNSVTIANLSTNATPGTPIVQNAGATPAILTVGNWANASGTFAGTIQDGIGGGTLTLKKAGAGTLTLSGSNTYSGTTTLSAGTLALSGGDNRLPSSGTLAFSNGNNTVLALGGYSQTLRGRHLLHQPNEHHSRWRLLDHQRH